MQLNPTINIVYFNSLCAVIKASCELLKGLGGCKQATVKYV
jgi:hypothetical protein